MKAKVFVEFFGLPVGSLAGAMGARPFNLEFVSEDWPESAMGSHSGLKNYPDAGVGPLYDKYEHIRALKWTASPI